MKHQLRNVLGSLIILLSSSAIFAQTFDLQFIPNDSTVLEFRHLRFIAGDNTDQNTISGTFDLRMKYVINEKINLLGRLNYTSLSFGSQDRLSDFGNTFVGLQFKRETSKTRNRAFNLGIFLPTAGENSLWGSNTNVQEFSTYLDEVLALRGTYAVHNFKSNGFRSGVEVGPDFLFTTGDGFSDDIEVFLNYGLTFGYNFSEVYILSEFIGLAILTEEGNFDERTIHGYNVGLGYDGGKARFSAYYKNYFDEGFDGFDGVLGFIFGYTIN